MVTLFVSMVLLKTTYSYTFVFAGHIKMLKITSFWRVQLIDLIWLDSILPFFSSCASSPSSSKNFVCFSSSDPFFSILWPLSECPFLKWPKSMNVRVSAWCVSSSYSYCVWFIDKWYMSEQIVNDIYSICACVLCVYCVLCIIMYLKTLYLLRGIFCPYHLFSPIWISRVQLQCTLFNEPK